MTAGVAAVAASYLAGGIPFGLLLYRSSRGGDIRDVGSGNVGATNVARTAGIGLGLLTLLLDGAKGAAAVFIGQAATGETSWASAAALAAVVGHCFPALFGFRGGKGVATACGAFVFLHPPAMGVALAVFLAAVAATRTVSVGSIAAALAFPASSTILGAGPAVGLCGAAAAALIVGRHHENIRRIAAGREGRLGGGKSR